jgi:protease I
MNAHTGLLVIAQEGFDEEAFHYLSTALEQAGIAVMTAAPSLDAATGARGDVVKPDLAIAQVKPADWDVVVFLGGSGARALADEPAARDLALSASAADCLVVGVDEGVLVLALAGILGETRATAPPAVAERVSAAGATLGPGPVERSNNLLTAYGRQALPLLRDAIVQAVASKQRAKRPRRQ